MKSFNLVTLVVATLFVDMAIVPVPVANAFRGEDDGPAELSLSDFRRQLMMGKMMKKKRKKKKRGMGMGSDDEDPLPGPVNPPTLAPIPLPTPAPIAPTPAPMAPVVLVNKHRPEASCITWAEQGLCFRGSVDYNPWMLNNCALSCEQAGTNFPSISPADQDTRDCVLWAEAGECDITPRYMWKQCLAECEDFTGRTRGPVDPPTDDPANSNGVDDANGPQ